MTTNQPLVFLTIDCECDKGAKWAVHQPLSFEGMWKGLLERLLPKCLDKGIPLTLLLSPEILTNHKIMSALCASKGLSFGTHLHYEFLPSVSRNIKSIKNTSIMQADLTLSEEYDSLVELSQLFKTKLGVNPQVFRAGRFGLGCNTYKILRELGYKIDTSVIPGRMIRSPKGRYLDHRASEISPYQVKENDIARQGSSELLEVPVSAWRENWMYPRGMKKLPLPIVKIGQRMINQQRKLLGKKLFCSHEEWIRPLRCNHPYEYADLINRMILFQSNSEVRVINIMFHNVELIPGASPYCQNEEEVDRFMEDLFFIINHLQREHNARFSHLMDAVQYFQ